jgi:hypothetical protein
MSISSLTTIATVREAASRSETPQRPTKGQIGKVPTGHTDADQHAGITDVLAKQIPTELIAPYTALTAALVGAVSKPTTKNPHPDQLAGWRWTAFTLLVASVILVVWAGKAQKSGTWNFPLVAASAGVLSAIAWAFLMPGSPLVPYLHSNHATTLVPLFVAVGGTVVAAVTAALLTSKPRHLRRRAKAA